jgi:hypothetical protein
MRLLRIVVTYDRYDSFEYTPSWVIFDTLGINIYHGWLADPSDKETYKLLSTISYNSMMEKLVEYSVAKSPTMNRNNSINNTINNVDTNDVDTNNEHTKEDTKLSQTILEGNMIESFLDGSATQLSYYGLYSLHKDVKEESLSVLFRGNHFSVMTKHKGELFILITDAGFSKEKVVWERLDDINNDGDFFLDDFTAATAPENAKLQEVLGKCINNISNDIASLLPQDLSITASNDNDINDNSEKIMITGHDYRPSSKEIEEQLLIENKIQQERKALAEK